MTPAIRRQLVRLLEKTSRVPLPARTCSALSLLVTCIRTDDVHHATAAYDLAVLADLFDGSTNLHDISPIRLDQED
jgi:hypothetical protein